MYEKDAPMACKPESKQTEAQRILDKFDHNIDGLDKITNVILNRVTALGGFERVPSEACDGGKPPQKCDCFINELDLRLEKLQRFVEAYDAIRYNLEILV